jgi:molybdenum ABC transporter molybdate-binding protein
MFSPACSGRASFWVLAAFGSLAMMAVLAVLLFGLARNPQGNTVVNRKPLLLFCAAGLKPPVEALARRYERAYGIPVQIQYGGSGTLMSNIRVSHLGDLFLAADESYIKSARELGLVAETIPLAHQRPVIVVRKGNAKHIHTLEDLRLSGTRFALANPDAASIGRTVRALLRQTGQWTDFERSAAVFKPTVNEVANDVKLGSVDAGIVWDATAEQYPELEGVHLPLFDGAPETISIGVLSESGQPSAALRFARYLGARDQGLQEFERAHYLTVDGDEWAETPELKFFSGAMLRPGVEQTLKEFERREGCRITTVYNDCGILIAQMRAGERPDACFACDKSFMSSVADLYGPPATLVEDRLVLLVQKGNPQGIRSVRELTRPGLRIGLPHHEKSALGFAAWKLLEAMGLYDQLGPNLKVESPTGDFLVNQMRTGSLDAVIACRSHYPSAQGHLDSLPIDHPLARLDQSFAVGRACRYPQMMARLLDALAAPASRARFESAGFGWRYQPISAP